MKHLVSVVLLLGCFVALASQKSISAGKKECGTRRDLSSKIVYGEAAREGEFPWQISLRSLFSHTCGGSILSDRWIITAAHCVAGSDRGTVRPIPVGLLSVLIGSLDRTVLPLGDGPEKLIGVSRIVVHPQYDPQHIVNDIALIELSQPIGIDQAGDNINAICLGRPEDVTTGREVVVSGWGLTENNEAPANLRKATNKIMDFDQCKEIYGKLTESHVCSAGNGNACMGDSGGPLQYQRDGRWYLMGLVSFGEKTCKKGFPVVFTRVPTYLDFVRNVTGLK